ncbi:uncharacterized protein LOC113312710 [Papaver somniferum]|uniref:uncharacterized protein LOC113312710 n=1 Tax=Papaver somniferum TaxID=3469 RepID=UPI000E6FA222|nr:uncharacterized protein LOC113312710 [Papaver somniferum]
MVWVQFPGLSLEYWDEKTLFTIGRAIGNPIKVDAATLQYQSSFYAKVLIEIDLAKTIPNKLWIITRYGAFSQGVTLTNLPKFCTKCKIVGHLTTECRLSKPVSQSSMDQNPTLSHQQEHKDNGPANNHIPATVTPTLNINEKNQGNVPHNAVSKNPSSSGSKSPTSNNTNISRLSGSNSSASKNLEETNVETPFMEVLGGASSTSNPSVNNYLIQINSNQFEALQDNDTDYSSSEDGEIKEVSTSNLLEFGTISQHVTILKNDSANIQCASDSIIVTKNAATMKKKPPANPPFK